MGKILGNALSHQVQSERMKEILKTAQGILMDMFKDYYKLKETIANIELESEYLGISF